MTEQRCTFLGRSVWFLYSTILSSWASPRAYTDNHWRYMQYQPRLCPVSLPGTPFYTIWIIHTPCCCENHLNSEYSKGSNYQVQINGSDFLLVVHRKVACSGITQGPKPYHHIESGTEEFCVNAGTFHCFRHSTSVGVSPNFTSIIFFYFSWSTLKR